MEHWPKLDGDKGGVPAGLDAISVDFYDEHNTDGQAEVDKNKDFYHKVVFPKLRPHQQALFVPGVFGYLIFYLPAPPPALLACGLSVLCGSLLIVFDCCSHLN